MSILDAAREGMNPDIRPQDDLFGHVNGRWLDEAEIPADKSAWGAFIALADDAEQQVREIITTLAEKSADELDGDESGDERKIGDLYASFMDTERINALGISPLQGMLDEVAALEDLGGLATFLGRFERSGGGGFFGSYVTPDRGDASRNIVYLMQGGLGLPDESYYREEKFAEIRGKYLAYLTHLLTLADHPSPSTAADTVMAFETRLAKGHWEAADTRDVQRTTNHLTLEELQASCPAFDFTAYADALGGSAETLARTVVMQPDFFEHLSSVLAETSVEDLRDVLQAKIVRSFASYLSDEFVEANFDFYGRTLNGTPELRERWKRGVAFVEGAIGEAVGKVYVSQHFPPASKQMMDELVDNLVKAYRVSIEALDWMGEDTKQKAYDKLEKFYPKIGYPTEFRDYSALAVSADDLLGNALASAAFETDRELAKVGQPVDRDEWLMLPQTVNAYYHPGTNEICFPAAILQPPFFSPEAESAENYGGIGAVIGHEIGHGFDDQGAQYDGDGNLHDWWTADDKAAFEAKSKKLIEQYDAFEPRNLPGEHVNGALTVGENIGDLGGLTIAHKAFVISEGGEASDDDRRTLFLNWAHVWRTKRRKEQELQYLTVDPHSPAEFRANIVRNLDEFHEVFETQPDDGLWLDTEDRVRIW
ncbi:peptidase M13 [Nocardioides seonyuensis]|uniref:Peptidase M13 n=1 Tax=Nocardioides seonyuensis TaxID=2518371 RepID=A0A4P7IHQ7_9ACTN|nr:M13-type metalloendopeptidase [Nocardioides seonyuensis]QBX55341.1 peptidase M13 [Nocardioides seonyuensis]